MRKVQKTLEENRLRKLPIGIKEEEVEESKQQEQGGEEEETEDARDDGLPW